jgi:arylsulfatase A-like enzyme
MCIRDRPWFLACGIFAPHLPWIAREEFFDLFPQEEMKIDNQLLEWVNNDLQDLSPTGKRITSNSGFTRLLKYGREIGGSNGDIAAWKEMVQAYLATIVFSDYCIGVLVDAIEKNPKKENTVVVLFSDHGYHLGDKNRDGKTTLWEASNHCNLMIYDPRIKAAATGKKADAGVSLQDIYPTLVDLAGLEKPAHIYGRSLRPVLENPGLPWNNPVLSTFGEGNHTLRTGDFRYLRFANGDRELYHISADVFELNNLANLSEWADKLKEMDDMLDQALLMKPFDFSTN